MKQFLVLALLVAFRPYAPRAIAKSGYLLDGRRRRSRHVDRVSIGTINADRHRLEVDDRDAKRIYAATQQAGLKRSTIW